nr:hypothetical protein [Vulcanisaeta sp.]
PMCIPGTYYVLTVYYVAQDGPRITIYETRNYPLGLYLLNGSLLFGGYLRAYDFYNETTIPITPIQYLAPTYQPEVTEYTRCTLTILTNPSMKTGDSPVNNAAINVMGNYTASMGNALINHVGWVPHGFAQYRALTALRRTWPTLVLR